MTLDRPATPEEQAAIDALGQQLDDLTTAFEEDRGRWWADFERLREERHREIRETFDPFYEQLAALTRDIKQLRLERAAQMATERQRRQERRRELLRRIGIR